MRSTRRITKQMKLSKETLLELGNRQLRAAAGGSTGGATKPKPEPPKPTWYTCPDKCPTIVMV
jgi:hypothetical protein